MKTRVTRVGQGQHGHFTEVGGTRQQTWEVQTVDSHDLHALKEAAHHLQRSDTPVAFPTETVYGLGADATRSAAVRGIYSAKGRPSDNPLIVHVCDLEMLRGLLLLDNLGKVHDDPIPSIYKPLIERFWPGPLTLLMPNPANSRLAPEVTAGLPSFGVRMPASSLALSLIKLTGAPLAAPSANASTKPSPTTAQQVLDDLDGRIELILDGGSCTVGVESTVVDGLCSPPVVLRPGGISLEELRSCPGWEAVVRGYKDHSEEGRAVPRAPGMKYKHYSPRAKVVLYESSFRGGDDGIVEEDVRKYGPGVNGHAKANGEAQKTATIGIIRTRRWQPYAGLNCSGCDLGPPQLTNGCSDVAESRRILEGDLMANDGSVGARVLDLDLGCDIRGVAKGLFSALRELDSRGADVIFVDGIDDRVDIGGAVMNRLRKAASEVRA